MKRFSMVATAILVLALSGCEKVKNSVEASFDEGFRKAFRASFMKHCVGNDSSEAHFQVCTCVVQDLLTTYTTEQLKDTDAIQTYIDEEALPACRESEG